MSNRTEVVPLTRTSHEIRRFLRVSYKIYSKDSLWVAPLEIDLKKVFTDKNPFFKHAEMSLWVARRNGEDVGRIAGILDRNYNRIRRDSAAFFCFFECIEDTDVSNHLFEAVRAWARGKGVQRLLGPMNPTTNEECGLLVEGFNSLPTFMMPYNPPYYLDLVLSAGFCKAKDLLAYYVDVAKCPLERLARIAEKTRKRYPELKFKPVRRATLASDLAKIKEVYNTAWNDNWGFVPMTDSEIDFMASRLKPLLLEGLVWVAETATEPVGFMLALPDYNIPLKPLRGRLLTPKLIGFIPYLVGLKYPPRCRVVTLGVKEKYRNRGLEAVMLTEGFKTGIRAGFKEAEASWILEDNTAMCRLMEVFGGNVYKRYRIFERNV